MRKEIPLDNLGRRNSCDKSVVGNFKANALNVVYKSKKYMSCRKKYDHRWTVNQNLEEKITLKPKIFSWLFAQVAQIYFSCAAKLNCKILCKFLVVSSTVWMSFYNQQKNRVKWLRHLVAWPFSRKRWVKSTSRLWVTRASRNSLWHKFNHTYTTNYKRAWKLADGWLHIHTN